MRTIGYILFMTCEYLNFNPGKLAPYIFGMMMGRMPHKKGEQCGKQRK
jgi:hypothetical protein